MAARGDDIVWPADGDDAYRLIVQDLVSLIEHAQASLRQIESAIDRKARPWRGYVGSCHPARRRHAPLRQGRCRAEGVRRRPGPLIDSEAAPHGSRYPDAAAAAVTPLRRQRPVPCRLLAPCLAAMHSKAYQALIGSLSMGAPPERFLPCLRPSGTGYPFPRR
jgi:hypothetical protein